MGKNSYFKGFFHYSNYEKKIMIVIFNNNIFYKMPGLVSRLNNFLILTNNQIIFVENPCSLETQVFLPLSVSFESNNLV